MQIFIAVLLRPRGRALECYVGLIVNSMRLSTLLYANMRERAAAMMPRQSRRFQQQVIGDQTLSLLDADLAASDIRS
jgi:hypothetical protein